MKLTGLALFALLVACASAHKPTPEAAQATSQLNCGDMRSETAIKGVPVLASPEQTAKAVAFLEHDTPVCASNETYGFGYRKVKLQDGNEGYVEDVDLYLKKG
jgi:hypothetical protein